MFNNIGKKIKLWAKITCWIGIIGCIILGIIFCALTYISYAFLISGLCTLIVGPFIAWISSWLLYSWGDVVDCVQAIKEKQLGENPSTPKTQKQTSTKQKLEELLASGLISREEYVKALEKEGLC